jgi:cytochrome c
VKNAGFTWHETSFAAFIANPRGKNPGNKMAFAGIKDETEIANFWAYLSHFNVELKVTMLPMRASSRWRFT